MRERDMVPSWWALVLMFIGLVVGCFLGKYG